MSSKLNVGLFSIGPQIPEPRTRQLALVLFFLDGMTLIVETKLFSYWLHGAIVCGLLA